MKNRILSHLLRSWKTHTSLMLVTILVLTGCFFVSGGLLLTGQNLQNVLTLWGDSLQMSVYVKDEISEDQAQALGDFLRKDGRVGHTEWVGREAALKSFQEQMASYAPDLLSDSQLLKFIPRSFQVQLSEKISSALQLETLRSLAQELKGNDSVEDVSYGQEWVKTYATITQTASKVGAWLIALLFAASAVVVSNSVSSSIQQRRVEIEVLELVGASKRFIRSPFLVEGICVGFLSGAIALGLLATGFSFLQGALQAELRFLQISEHLHFFSAFTVIAFLVGAMLLGLCSAHLSLRRLNDGWAASRARQRSDV